LKTWRLLLTLILVVAVLVWWRLPRSQSAVDWSRHPVVVLQSDDWGLCAWLPDTTRAEVIVEEIERWDIYGWARSYHRSTLESAADVDALVELLVRHRGGDGMPAILQSNTIVAAPDYERIEARAYEEMILQELGEYGGRWRRPGLLPAIRRGMSANVWYPEYHGLLHINAQRWLELLRGEDPETLRMFEEEILLNDDWSDEYEYDASLPYEERERQFRRGMELFESLFGRRAVSTIAPDYAWPADQERIFRDAGIEVVQGWRAQTMQPTGVNRIRRAWRRIARPMGHYDDELDLLYLVRNVHFEPDGNESAVEDALRDVQRAWSNSEPAIISTHRVNYARLDAGEAERSRSALDRLLASILELEPRTVFLTDAELRQLYRRGHSALRIQRDELRLRNYLSDPVRVDLPAGSGPPSVFALNGSVERLSTLLDPSSGDFSLELPPGDFLVLLSGAEGP